MVPVKDLKGNPKIENYPQDVKEIFANHAAFAALRCDGSVAPRPEQHVFRVVGFRV